MMLGRTQAILQKPTETKLGTGGSSSTWEDVQTFYGSFQPVTATEGEKFGREAVEATHILYAMGSAIAADNVGQVKEKNRLTISGQGYDITGVHAWPTFSGGSVHHYEIALKVAK